MTPIIPRLMSPKQAQEYTGFSRKYLRELSDKGIIPCKKFGKRRHFLKDQIDEWMESLPEWVEKDGR